MPNFFLAYSAQFLLTTMVYQYVSSVSTYSFNYWYYNTLPYFCRDWNFFFYQKRQTFKKKKKQAQEPPQYGRPSVSGPWWSLYGQFHSWFPEIVAISCYIHHTNSTYYNFIRPKIQWVVQTEQVPLELF